MNGGEEVVVMNISECFCRCKTHSPAEERTEQSIERGQSCTGVFFGDGA